MSSYKLNSSFEIVGSFWEKGNEQGRMNGTLISDKGRLRFQSSPDFKTLTDQQLRETFLNDQGERKKIDAVRGYTREDICTLFYLMELSDDGVINFDEKYSITALKWNVNAAVMGLHLDSAEANCLDRAAFTFTKIYKWLPSNLHFAISDEGLTFVSPSKPLPVFNFVSKALDAEVQCEVFSMSAHRINKVERIKPAPVIKVKPGTPKSLDWFYDIALWTENFFTLLLGTTVALNSLRVFSGEKGGSLVRNTRRRDQKTDVAAWIRCNPETIAKALEKWLAVPNDKRDVEKTLLNVIRKSSLFVETEFLSLAQALEGFDRTRSTDNPSFGERIERAHALLPPAFATKLVGDKAQFIREVVDTRNVFTHLGLVKRNSLADDPGRLFRLNECLHAFLRCVILIDLGIPEDAFSLPILHQAKRWK